MSDKTDKQNNDPKQQTSGGADKPATPERDDKSDSHHVPGADGPLGAEAEEDNNP